MHVDLDAFFASVEVLLDPSLKGKPVLVGGTGPRGVVAAASYESRKYGCRSAMPMVRARRLCPQAVVLPARYDTYAGYSARVHEIFRSYTPLVEGIALDEAFLDVTGSQAVFGRGEEIGAEVRRRIREELGLAASVGVAANKLVAKLATEAAKPDGLLVVAPGAELAFLHPQPVSNLWGVGPATLARLERFGTRTIGDLAALPEETLVHTLGNAAGRNLYRLSHGLDDRPVEAGREIKSIGQEETYPKDVYDRPTLDREARRMADRVAAKVREKGLVARTVTIKVRFPDFRTITRSVTAPKPVSAAADVARLAVGLLDKVDVALGVRLLGVSAHGLLDATEAAGDGPAAEQGRLFGDTGPSHPGPATERVQRAVDEVRSRFGDGALGPASLLGPDEPNSTGRPA